MDKLTVSCVKAKEKSDYLWGRYKEEGGDGEGEKQGNCEVYYVD